MMLKIKRVPTVVSNYQKEEAEEGGRDAVGCGRNCLRSCCLPGSKLPLYAFKKVNKVIPENGSVGSDNKELPVEFLDSLLLGEWEDRMQRGLFRYDVTACETKVIPGKYGFIAQLNEGRHLKKRPTEFRVDKVLQPFDENKFNFIKVGQDEVLQTAMLLKRTTRLRELPRPTVESGSLKFLGKFCCLHLAYLSYYIRFGELLLK